MDWPRTGPWTFPSPSQSPRPQLLEFRPDPALQAISYRRAVLARARRMAGLHGRHQGGVDLEAAENLASWAIPALCRGMSLDNILTFLAAALQECQVNGRRGLYMCNFFMAGLRAVLLDQVGGGRAGTPSSLSVHVQGRRHMQA